MSVKETRRWGGVLRWLRCLIGDHDYWCRGGPSCSMGFRQGCCWYCRKELEPAQSPASPGGK